MSLAAGQNGGRYSSPARWICAPTSDQSVDRRSDDSYEER